ncbi:MAG: hypothetical protein OIF57_10010 [Marinobacterium sp.]|nr:hypothetical protein [Marinobacterium sp.]
MKIVYCIPLLAALSLNSFAADFFNPSHFNGSASQKKQVISFIKENVDQTYTAIGMGDPSTLRMMEKEELNAFKKLTKVKNKKLLNNVIVQYCNIGMCNYSTILMMYQEQNVASSQQLTW